MASELIKMEHFPVYAGVTTGHIGYVLKMIVLSNKMLAVNSYQRAPFFYGLLLHKTVFLAGIWIQFLAMATSFPVPAKSVVHLSIAIVVWFLLNNFRVSRTFLRRLANSPVWPVLIAVNSVRRAMLSVKRVNVVHGLFPDSPLWVTFYCSLVPSLGGAIFEAVCRSHFEHRDKTKHGQMLSLPEVGKNFVLTLLYLVGSIMYHVPYLDFAVGAGWLVFPYFMTAVYWILAFSKTEPDEVVEPAEEESKKTV